MRKRLRMLVLSVILILIAAPAALAGPVTAEDLQQLFPEMPAGDSILTRGVFAALLAEAAGIEVGDAAFANQDEAWYLAAVRVLQEKEIIRGYPDGSLHLDRPVSLLEAAVMSSRVLGLPDAAVPPEVEAGLGEESWGYTPYAWLTRVGVLGLDEDPAAYLTVEEGLAFLTKVFGTDPKAEGIMRAAQESQNKIKDLRFTSHITMSLLPRPDAAGIIPALTMKGSILSEFVYHPLSMHQLLDMTVNLPVELIPGGELPEGGKVRINIEQYLADGNLYQKVEIPGAAEPIWMKIPGEAIPDLEALLEQSGNYAGLSPELWKALYLRYLGEGVVEGRKVHRIAYYGRLDDWQALMEALPAGLAPEVRQALVEAAEVLECLSFWGEEAIGVEDSLPYASEMTGLVVLAGELQGQALPLESITFTIRSRDYQYDTGLAIELPPEALAAEELPSVFPRPEAGALGQDTAQ